MAFHPINRDTDYLLPPSVQEWLPESHLARYVVDVVEGLDLSALVRAYLTKYPSRSFTLRNLSARLAQFIHEEPKWTRPHTARAHAVARFEWAQTVAFDGEARPAITVEELARTPPAKLRLGLQP